MNTLALNQIALWKPKLFDQLTIREAGAGRPYIENKIIKKTTDKTYRYAKNYEKGKHKFCLFVITYANNADVVERQLDDVAKKLKASEIAKAVEDSTDATFTYTKYSLEEK